MTNEEWLRNLDDRKLAKFLCDVMTGVFEFPLNTSIYSWLKRHDKVAVKWGETFKLPIDLEVEASGKGFPDYEEKTKKVYLEKGLNCFVNDNNEIVVSRSTNFIAGVIINLDKLDKIENFVTVIPKYDMDSISKMVTELNDCNKCKHLLETVFRKRLNIKEA